MVHKEVRRDSCHCGAVGFEVSLPNGLEELRRCNCSMCRRREAVTAPVALDGFRIVKGENRLSLFDMATDLSWQGPIGFCDHI